MYVSKQVYEYVCCTLACSWGNANLSFEISIQHSASIVGSSVVVAIVVLLSVICC